MIEKAIHEIVASSDPAAASLRGLVAASKIVTGDAFDFDLPYVTVNIDRDLPEYRSNGGSLRNYTARFQAWHEDHATGASIRDAIIALFEDRDFEATGYRIASARYENGFALQEGDGTWQFVIDIEFVATKKA